MAGPSKIPQSVIDEMSNDKDFLAMSDEDQDEVMHKIEQKFGHVQKPESVLSRAARYGKSFAEPFTSGIGSANPLAPIQGAENVKESIVSDITNDPTEHFLLGLAPDVLSGGFLGGRSAIRSVKNAPKALKGRFGSAGFGKSMEKLQGKTPEKRVNFSNAINKYSDDSGVQKVLEKSDVIKRFGGRSLGEGGATSENLANLTLQESQDMLNALKDEVRQAVKLGNIKPKELGVAKLFSELANEQVSAFPKFKSVRRNYGIFKNVGKGVKSGLKAAIPGAGIGIGGTLGHYLAKKLIGK